MIFILVNDAEATGQLFNVKEETRIDIPQADLTYSYNYNTQEESLSKQQIQTLLGYLKSHALIDNPQ